MSRLALMWVSGGAWRECFGRSLAQFLVMDGHNRRLVDGFAYSNGLYVDQNRNKAAEMFLQSDCEWALNFDTDIQFAWDIPYRLMDIADAKLRPIVSALYVGRITTYSDTGALQAPALAPMFYRRKPNGMYHTVGELQTMPQEIDGIGMGCVLIHRSVFEGIPDTGKPSRWFECVDRETSHGWMFIGEDLIFCERAQAAGFRIFGDSRIQVGHEKSDFLTVDDLIRSAR